MLIPLRHENMKGRRWPVITFTLIGLNILFFLLTHGPISDEQPHRAEVRLHLILLAASHPELQPSNDAATFVERVKKSVGENWEQLASSKRAASDAWEAQIRSTPDPAELQQEMDKLSQEFQDLEQSSILDRYAFIPARPHALSYLTANFLHSGWMHLIGNMWFLWLAGFILEDTWGRLIYSVFYLVAGAAALQFYAWCAHGSFTPLVGASGAVAALMGAFLVRFPKLKIEMLTWVLFYRVRFKAPAYWLLPLWLAAEFFYGTALGSSSPVAHWAHVGGFVFGMVGAFVIRQSGLEQKASEAIEFKIGWTSDPDIIRATEAIEQDQLDDAAAILRRHLADKPASLDALTLQQQVHWRRNDRPSYLQATIALCQFQLKTEDFEGAWRSFEEYTNGGGDKLPAATWLEIARHLESQGNLDRAVSEYDRLAATHPTEKPALLALLAAGRLCLKKLNKPEAALDFYKRAHLSPIPHLDWESNIQFGIAEAEKIVAGPVAGVSR